MTVPAEELIRRYLLRILPDRFVRIRCYGLFLIVIAVIAVSCSEPSSQLPSLRSENRQAVLLRVIDQDPDPLSRVRSRPLRRVEEPAPLSRHSSGKAAAVNSPAFARPAHPLSRESRDRHVLPRICGTIEQAIAL
jgi:hypothetical protein